MKYSIVMPYWNRRNFNITLQSFVHHYKDRNDYEVIIVEDDKSDIRSKNELLSYIQAYGNQINIKRFTYSNGGSIGTKLYNYGVGLSSGKYIILTNPECSHVSNILKGLDNLLETCYNSYIICGCYNGRINSIDNGTYEVGMGEWYQHSVHRNANLHFCSCISKELYLKIGGFDEFYAGGIGYDDNDFNFNVQYNNIPIILKDELVVCHIEHDKGYQLDAYKQAINRKYYLDKWTKRGYSQEYLLK